MPKTLSSPLIQIILHSITCLLLSGMEKFDGGFKLESEKLHGIDCLLNHICMCKPLFWHCCSAGTGTPLSSSTDTGMFLSPYWNSDPMECPVLALGQSIETPNWHPSNIGTGAVLGWPILALVPELGQTHAHAILALSSQTSNH